MLESISSLFKDIQISIRFLIFIILSIIILYISSNIYNNQVASIKNEKFTQISNTMLSEAKILIQQKKNTSLMLAISLSDDPILIDIAFDKPYLDDKLSKFTSKLSNYPKFKNVWFSVANEDGELAMRSWDKIQKDEFIDNTYILEILKSKKQLSKSEITLDKYGLAISNMTPILYDNNDIVGVFNIITHFNSFTQDFLNLGYNSIIFLDKKRSQQVDIQYSVSKNFIDDYYVVNKNADDVSMKILTNKGLEYYMNLKDSYFIDEETNSFGIVYKIKNTKDEIMGYMVLIKKLSDIDMENMEIIQNIIKYITIFLIIAIGLILYYQNVAKQIGVLQEENDELKVINSTINEKNSELDLNEKKMVNMFNIQPNFVISTNGKTIENINTRMRWLLCGDNKEQGESQIKQKYKCISELFEPCDLSNNSEYLVGDTIEGIPWKDYMLTNFKRDYKACIRDPNGILRHFKIKIDEMKYLSPSQRYIIIVFNDITKIVLRNQEIKNSLNKILLTTTDLKFKNDTNIIKTEDINSMSNDILEGANAINKLIGRKND